MNALFEYLHIESRMNSEPFSLVFYQSTIKPALERLLPSRSVLMPDFVNHWIEVSFYFVIYYIILYDLIN
jgi:hypothetical protein